MTREDAKDKMLTESVQYKNGLRTVELRKINNFIDKIFYEHEKDIKDKDKEIERLENRVYALENDTIVQNMEQRLIDISLVINGKLTSKDNA